MIKIAQIEQQPGTQARAGINEAVVAEYVQAIQNGAQFPPVILFFDGMKYWIGDGWHRLIAHTRTGCLTIHEDIRPGSARDAQRYALGANSGHGLQRTNADKRHAVGIALADAEWSQWSNKAIGKLCSVSDILVADVRKNNAITCVVSKKEPINNDVEKRKFTTSTGKTAERTVKVEPENIEEAHPDYTELEAAHDQIAELQDLLAVQHAPDELKSMAVETIASLREEVRQLKINLAAVTVARDSLMAEKAQMMKQLEYQRKEIARLKK